MAECWEWLNRFPTNPDLDSKLTHLKDSPADNAYSERITQLVSQDPKFAESLHKFVVERPVDADKACVIFDRISAESKVLLEELNSLSLGENCFGRIESTAQRDYWSVALSLFFLALVVIVLLWA